MIVTFLLGWNSLITIRVCDRQSWKGLRVWGPLSPPGNTSHTLG